MRSTQTALLQRQVADEPDSSFDPDRVLETLDRHGVAFLLVGGLAARAHGAARQTADVDCVPDTSSENLGRMAAALLDLNARLRVGGMTDDEASNPAGHDRRRHAVGVRFVDMDDRRWSAGSARRAT